MVKRKQLHQMIFETTLQQYDDSEDLYIEIPQEVLETLNWKDGDELNWQIRHQEIILTKIENTTTIKKQHSKTNNNWYKIKEEAIKKYLESDEQSQKRSVPSSSNFPHFS